MRFQSISIENFKGIREFRTDRLGDLVVIAGPNGCGKSSVLDAIRLLKSTYGGYKPNEWKSWFQEFNLDINKPWFADGLLHDRTKSLHISASIELSDQEKRFLEEHAVELIAEKLWRESPGYQTSAATGRSLPQDLREQPEIIRKAEASAADIRQRLTDDTHELILEVSPGRRLAPVESPVLELVFGTYRPGDLGVFEFQSASRIYGREKLGQVNLDLQSNLDRQMDQTLYDLHGKYRSIKSHLAADYLYHLIANQTGTSARTTDLNVAMSELFDEFFPGKKYAGPRPDSRGSIHFPVLLSNGETHDIDELSSGEKEIVYGYLRLRSARFTNSVILIDEPELHLNPALLRNLPDFYHRHLGISQNTQIWLITHSDMILRHCAGHPKYTVYFMADAAQSGPASNQASPVLQDSELAEATLALVGDLTTYRPFGKVVIVEGEGFDADLISRLYPEFSRQVNLGSAADKNRVKSVATHLRAIAQRLGLGNRVYSICDRDFDAEPTGGMNGFEYRWDVYHIENYLLVPRYIMAAHRALCGPESHYATESEIESDLRHCARQIVGSLTLQKLQEALNNRIVTQISIGSSPKSSDPIPGLISSIEATALRLSATFAEVQADHYLARKRDEIQADLNSALDDGSWIAKFPGRDVLRRFAGSHVPHVRYENFRNVIIDQMAQDGHQPEGMSIVLDHILEED